MTRRASSQAAVPALPAPLAGFEHVNRYWDRARGCCAAKILPGEYYVTAADEIVCTVLGSCVSACVRDSATGIGGMNHFMLPRATGAGDAWAGTAVNAATRYGSHAMEHLINCILACGGRRETLEVKLFGGGRILEAMTDIGLRNIAFVREYLRREALELVGEDLGGPEPRKLVYQPASGRAWVKRLRTLHNGTVLEREWRYRRDIEKEPVAGDVELF